MVIFVVCLAARKTTSNAAGVYKLEEMQNTFAKRKVVDVL